jgi:zinc transport system substrate-binding protein
MGGCSGHQRSQRRFEKSSQKLANLLYQEKTLLFLKKPVNLVVLVLVFTISALTLLGGCSAADSTKLKVVTSTSLLQQLVERIGGDYVEVINIIPPAQCPGHFDVKPGDIQKLADAQLFFMHNWQGEKFSSELITSANNQDLVTVIVELAGNWMTPDVQQAAAEKIMAALAQADPANAGKYEKGLKNYQAAVTAKETSAKERLSKVDLTAVNVLCDEQQAGFIEWAGLNVVAAYGRPDTFTPEVVKSLVDQGRAGAVTLVIDNMQTGGESGKSLAEELGVKQITLSNFPGGYDDTATWEKALDKNLDLILAAVAK